MRAFSTAKISKRHQLEMKQQFPEVEFLFFDHINDLYQKVAPPFYRVDVLITYGEDLTESNIIDFPDLKWIQVISAGVELMPLKALQSMNVRVTNAKGIHGIPMGEYTLGVMLQIARRSLEIYENQKKHLWDRTIRTEELFGKTLGVLGFGAIGQEIAKRANAIGMNVIGLNSTGAASPFASKMFTIEEIDRVLTDSDFVVSVLPLTQHTVGLLNKQKFKKMKNSAWFINIARGGIVNEEDLMSALKERDIAGAVLDVFQLEPLPESSPFWGMDNVILTPHLSGRSPYYMERALQIFHKNLACYISNAGREYWINIIDADKGY